MRKMKLIKALGVTAALVSIMTSTAFAAYKNWTSYETSYVDDAVTSDNYSVRYTDDDAFGVYVKDMTMWSTPKAKVVNSEGASRSSWLSLSDEEEYLYGTNNTCENNHMYYLKIKPAWNQVGEDTIKYKFSVR
ncbi:MAG: hypothetical protein J6L69_06885 [Lachnospiraceae bacterium]|nr:hypothetical protein [Lachnospiraceae bacterium]